MVGHGCHAGVRPNIFCRLDHVDDGIDRKDETHDGDRRSYSRHQREGEEEAAHGHSGIAYCRHHRDDKPQEHDRKRELKPAVMHHEERSDEDERRATVHIYRGTDGQHKTGYTLTDSKPLL